MTWDLAQVEARIDAIETFLSNWLAETGVPGVSAALTTSDGIAWSDGFGSRNLETNAPATAETMYGMGSITKSFTALAVLELESAGELSIDDPVTDYLDIELPGGSKPSLAQLMTHRSGFPSLATSAVLIARRAGIGETGLPLGDRDDFYQHIAGAEREYDPDVQRFMYSNEGYVLLAHTVEAVDGRSLAAYLADEVFAPLGMDRSTFSHEVFAGDPDTITPYRFEDEEPVETDFPVRELSEGPGGLLAPVTDMTRYLRMHLENGSIEGAPVIESDVLQRATKPRVETPSGPYGYGWRTRTLLGEQIVGHSGSIAVSTAYAGFLPDADIGVAVACNTSPGHSLRHVGEAIAAGALGKAPESIPFFQRKERLDRLTGTYETYRGAREGTVERRGGVLELTLTDAFGEQRHALIPQDSAAQEFETLGDAGERWPVEFVEREGTLDLLIKRWRLHKIAP